MRTLGLEPRRRIRIPALIVVEAISIPRARLDLKDTAEISGVLAVQRSGIASFDDDHNTARQFLTTDAARTWHPNAGAVVYDSSAPT